MEQNLNLYHIFVTVARCRNISGAARELYISQPAISKAISRLEQNLNTTLFLRSSRGVKLTEAGELLYRQVESAFHAISQGEAQLKKIHELGIGHLSIGVSTTLCKYVLLPYLSRFTRENPHIQISISCQSTYQTMQALEDGAVDVGLIGENDRLDRLTFHPILEIEDIFVCTSRYLDNLHKRITPSEKKDPAYRGQIHDVKASDPISHSSVEILQNSTLMMLDKENITRQYVDKYLTLEEITPAQTLEATSMDLLIDFARIDLGIACVIRNFVQEELSSGKLLRLPMPLSIPPRNIGFARLKGISPYPCVRKFLDFCEIP